EPEAWSDVHRRGRRREPFTGTLAESQRVAAALAAARRRAQAAQLAVQRLARDAEAAGRRGLRREGLEPLADERQLDAGQQGGERRGLGGRADRVADRAGQMLGTDALVVGDRQDQAMHLVLQLPDVARPRVAREQVERLLCEAGRLAPLLALEAGEEAGGQLRDVGRALAERRDAGGGHAGG